MPFVTVASSAIAGFAADLAGIGDSLTAAHAAAVPPTTGLLAAANDEVSTAIAAMFSDHGRNYQAISAEAASFHEQFVQLLKSGAGQYVSTEAANAKPLQTVQQGIVNEVNALKSVGTELMDEGNLIARTDVRLARTAVTNTIKEIKDIPGATEFWAQDILQAPTALDHRNIWVGRFSSR
ncbi:PE family protein [Mycobacterium sp.]|uniref:PE family protein n=1 Tax=Mycobacterium sp. TaxID=1785 RepID=UPI0025EE0FB4|nr:PE family protein [Mycobacterium sp.]MBW0013183.1 PE family protein [Mycobacterium sp.]